MIEIKAEPLTRGIKNCRDSRLFKGCSPLQLLCNLIGNRPQSATCHILTVNGCENNNNYSACPISKGGGWSFYGNDVRQICERKTSHPNNGDGIGIRLVK